VDQVDDHLAADDHVVDHDKTDDLLADHNPADDDIADDNEADDQLTDHICPIRVAALARSDPRKVLSGHVVRH
jgi:hypothetical protein